MEPVAIVIECTLEREHGRHRSFNLVEYAELNDGSRVRLRADRGWHDSIGRPGDPWAHETLEKLELTASAALEPDHPVEWFDWMVPILREHGVVASVDTLMTLPFVVEFSDVILRRLPENPPIGEPAVRRPHWPTRPRL